MKKTIIAVLIVLPVIGISSSLVPSHKFYEFDAQIENDRGNVYLYETKIANSTTTCVVATQKVGASGSNLAIDCK